MLGIHAALGRTFVADEDKPGRHVVVLSDSFWRRAFNADPGVIGRSIAIAGRPYSIIGVMPAGFQFPIRSEARDMWVTVSRQAETDDPKDTPTTGQRGNHQFEAIGRLKPVFRSPKPTLT